jgi:hypothetical protein
VNHRQVGVDLFNEVWRLMETREDDERMLHAAYASAYHWAEAPEWDLPFAYEAVARAHGVAGDEEARRYEELARKAAEAIADPEDREHLEEALATLQ